MESVNIFPTTAYLNTPIYAQNNMDTDIQITIDDVETLVSAHQTVVISAHSKGPGIRFCKYEFEGVEYKTAIHVDIPAAFSKTNWGHQPANTIYIHLVKDIETCMKKFSLQGGTIKDQRTPNLHISPSRKVPAVAFSDDDKRLISVSTDGTIVIRNLNLPCYASE